MARLVPNVQYSDAALNDHGYQDAKCGHKYLIKSYVGGIIWSKARLVRTSLQMWLYLGSSSVRLYYV